MRHLFEFVVAATAALLLPVTSGQQLGFRYPYETMNFSDSCLRTLNTNVTDCSPGLFYHSPNPVFIFETLVEEELAEICHGTCYNNLTELRSKTVATCNTEMDAVAYIHKDKIYPRKCEDCLLAPLRIELEAGISYNDVEASEFEDITSSCNATGYEYTRPDP